MADVKDIQLSRNTVTQQCVGIAGNLKDQLKNDIDSCECFSLQLNESTDIKDVAHLCILVWCSTTSAKEILAILPLKGHTLGEDILVSGQNPPAYL